MSRYLERRGLRLSRRGEALLWIAVIVGFGLALLFLPLPDETVSLPNG